MNVAYYSLNLGSNETGEERRKAYEKAAIKAGERVLAVWIKNVCDKAAGFKAPESGRRILGGAK